MSKETTQWLNTMTLRGFTEERGKAWHYMASAQGDEPNHYPGAIPPEDVIRRLFHWQALAVVPTYTVPEQITEDGVTPERVFTADDRRLIVRSDSGAVLGAFRDSYAIHQYDEWLMNNIGTILDDTLQIGSAGLLKGGAVGWVQVDVPENITTPEGVEFRPHLFATTSMDGSLATTYGRSVTQIVCDNTLSAGMGEKGMKYTVRHSKHSGMRIADAREALMIVHTIADDFAKEVAALSQIKVTPVKFGKFLDRVAPIPTDDTTTGKRVDPRAVTVAEGKRALLTKLWKSDPRVEPWAGTGYGAMQLMNTYRQHFAAVRDGQTDPALQGGKRYARSIMSAADGTLDKQATEDRQHLMAAVG